MDNPEKSVILFAGSDERNGDYSAIRECCENGKAMSGWSRMKDLQKSDQVFLYVSAPIRAIVAVGEALADAKPGKNYRHECRIGNLRWITPHITLNELAKEFPDWGWATKGLGKCTIPREYADRLSSLSANRTTFADRQVQTHVLLSGLSRRDDLAVAAEKGTISKRWICPQKTKAGDRILIYYWGPSHAIVASATAVSNARRHRDGRFETNLRDIRWLKTQITLDEMRSAFPDWRWTKNCASRITLPPVLAAALWRLCEDDRNAEEDAIKSPRKNGGGGFGDPETNRLVEVSAVNFVTAHLRKSGYSVRSREQDKIGYDLDAVRENEELHVEVKGRMHSILGFNLTRNERSRAESDPAFRLFVVTDATGKSPELHQFDCQSMNDTFDLQPDSFRATLREPGNRNRSA